MMVDLKSQALYEKLVPMDIKLKTMDICNQFPQVCTVDALLAPYTSYRVGGPADLLMIPDDVDQLQNLVRACNSLDVPFLILGHGANVLVHDAGIRGGVLMLNKCCNQLIHDDQALYVGAGVSVQDLVLYCETHSLDGLDYMSGIPGTVGGALRMNAGAFVGEIGDRVTHIDALDRTGERIRLTREEAGFDYRRADGLVDKILLGCWIVVETGDRTRLTLAREDYLERRADMQPLEFPSCGSVFKRPQNDYAGRLIQASGLKGLAIGGAMVSEKHANFIVNFNNASASDIYEVVCTVQDRVYKDHQVWLQPEVKFLGFSENEVERTRRPADGA